MDSPTFDTVIVGQPCNDTNVDADGTSVNEVGGAVVYAGYAVAALGHPVAVVPKCGADLDAKAVFAQRPAIQVFPAASPASSAIKNVYHTTDKERRTSTATSRIDPYAPADLPDVQGKIWHLAGLVVGDIPNELILECAKRGKVAVDVQGMLRQVLPDGSMELRDWEAKREYLPQIDFLKTDAAEAQMMTGTSDRRKAAELLHLWGAKEVMVTHNTEVICYDGNTMHVEPLLPRNLSGRSGRGDTTFSSYLAERTSRPADEALLVAAALVSLKMEKVGPYLGDRAEVGQCIKERFHKEIAM
ncbi:MAG: PfkB family carbohydrate kinase [Propionibacteriaceae bacterium]|nr:PfkB family carbohydrate kinase [Propionibacteriaceae bacterium]